MVAKPFGPLVIGRALSGAIALGAAGALCRLTGLTDDMALARQLGVAVAAVDGLSLAVVVAAGTPATQRRAANLNAGTDVVLASALFVHSAKQSGSRRISAAAAGAFVLGGAAGW
ncbi:MAG: hypothetical protein ACRD0U_05350, partial [Acidimicrobiales bacterium]